MPVTDKNISLAAKLIPEFGEAIQLRREAAAVSPFKPATKIELADKALDQMEQVVAYLILRVQQVQ